VGRDDKPPAPGAGGGGEGRTGTAASGVSIASVALSRPLSRVLARLEESGCRHLGRNGAWRSRCPAHDDRRPSLSLAEAEDGRVLIKCHAGCATEAVLERLGLTWRELFPEHGHGNGHRERPARPPATDPLSWWADRCGVPREWLRRLPIEAQEGAIAFTWAGLDTRKLRAPDRKGWWQPEDGPRPPLWPSLPEAAPPVLLLTEGESDATVAAYCVEALGLQEKAFAAAVTKGAGQKPEQALLQELVAKGFKGILLIPDVDEAGREWASVWAEAARRAGLLAQAIDLAALGMVSPSLGEKDLRDGFRRRSVRVMGALKAAIEELAQEAPNFTSDIIPRVVGSKVPTAAELRGEAPREFRWLPFLGQEGFIWEGSVTLLSGYPKVGKSTVLTWLMLEWAAAGRKVHILTEEGLEVWRRRLAAMPDGPWERVTIQPALALGVEGLCQVLRDTDADVIVVDTLRKVAPLGSFRDSAEVNAAFVAILSARQEAQAKRGRPITLVLAHHDRKSSEGAEEGQRVADSHVVFGSVDTVLELVRGEGNRRLLRGWGRLVEPPTVIIEMAEDGALRILGSPQEVALGEVKGKVLGVLEEAEGWLTTKEVREAMPIPKPSDDQLRKALMELARKGLVERAPPLSEGTKQGVTYRWRLAPGQPNLTSDDRGCNSGSKVATAPPADLFAQTLAGELEAEEDEPQAQAEREEASPPWAHLPLWVQTVLGEFCEADGEGLRWREPPEGTAQGATGPPPRPCVECGALATTAMRRPAYGGVDDSDSRR